MSKVPSVSKSCLICGKPAAEKFRPFCSQRCTNVDLNRWFSGAYAVPAVDDDATEGIDGPESTAGAKDDN